MSVNRYGHNNSGDNSITNTKNINKLCNNFFPTAKIYLWDYTYYKFNYLYNYYQTDTIAVLGWKCNNWSLVIGIRFRSY